MTTFFNYLCAQSARNDAVGVASRYALRDKLFPRTSDRLNLLLLRYERHPEIRAGIKEAHAEWRRTRKVSRRRAEERTA